MLVRKFAPALKIPPFLQVRATEEEDQIARSSTAREHARTYRPLRLHPYLSLEPGASTTLFDLLDPALVHALRGGDQALYSLLKGTDHTTLCGEALLRARRDTYIHGNTTTACASGQPHLDLDPGAQAELRSQPRARSACTQHHFGVRGHAVMCGQGTPYTMHVQFCPLPSALSLRLLPSTLYPLTSDLCPLAAELYPLPSTSILSLSRPPFTSRVVLRHQSC